jgi:glutathione S-transferase
MTDDAHAPYRVYKLDISYFSGKLEAYLRYKEIAHEAESVHRGGFEWVARHTGFAKIPAVETADGLWLHDTTPMLQWFEARYPTPPVLPPDPALRFVALLLEDYGDEWLWRPSMWWRWMPPNSGDAVGRAIATEVGLPRPVRGAFARHFTRRQAREWLWDDGMTRDNEADVRAMLPREFEFLEPLFERQPFLLGSHPSVADYGYFASMFRHFGNDPVSAEFMRREGPGTYEWLARLWNARASRMDAEPHWQWPEGGHWLPLLERIARDYLPYLHQNACAYRDGQARFDHRGATFTFPGTKTTNYRVWCREVLQREFGALDDDARARVDGLFEPAGGLAALHEDGTIASGMDAAFELPMDPRARPPRQRGLFQRLGGQPRN